MAYLSRARVVSGAHLAAWRRSRHIIRSAMLLVAGLAGALGGGWLIGRWCLGLVLIAESAGLMVMGVLRDDGAGLPGRGERTPIEAAEQHWRGAP